MPAIIFNCQSLGCTSAQTHGERISEWLKSNEFDGVPSAVDELILRMTDDLKNRWFLYVQPDFVSLYENKEPFGGRVAGQFPSAIVDIEEAAKCLALNRSTACVFHLMRAIEVGIKAILRVLKIGAVYSNWGAYIAAINAAIKGHTDEAFFREIAGDLQAIKIAWRNPSMHVERTYTTDQAHDIYRAVRTFIQTLAERVGEK